MRDNFERCLAITLKHEGGWADHPQDPGGATMKGVTIGTYSQWLGRKATKAELRAIPEAHLRAIYRRNYWDKVRGDDLPAGLDLVAFDGAVNSGPARGARWLQMGLGVSADGRVGVQTIAAANAAEPLPVVLRAIDARMAFLRGLKTWQTFGNGWLRRLVEIQAAAQAMIGSDDAPMSSPPAAHKAGVPPVEVRPIATKPVAVDESHVEAQQGFWARLIMALMGIWRGRA